jgi:hypothetical protein
MKNILLTTAIAISLTTPAFASDDKDHDKDYKIVKVKGDTGPQGPKGDTGPQGVAGAVGPKGDPGVVDYGLIEGYDAVVAGMAGLEIVTPDQKGWSWGGGFGGTDLESAVSFGLAYGVGETSMLYGKMSKAFNTNATSYFVGLSGKF